MRQAARRGFTLLEVLAAVAILGLVFTLLSGVAARWLGAEGESRRRLEASLLADRSLAEIEAQIQGGDVPPPGDNETQAEDPLFRVRTVVQNLVLPIELADKPGVQRKPDAPTLFPKAPNAPGYLRRIDVIVGWEEAGQPLTVERSTVAFDRKAAEPVLAAIPRPEQPGEADQKTGKKDAKDTQGAKDAGTAGSTRQQPPSQQTTKPSVVRTPPDPRRNPRTQPQPEEEEQ